MSGCSRVRQGSPHAYLLHRIAAPRQTGTQRAVVARVGALLLGRLVGLGLLLTLRLLSLAHASDQTTGPGADGRALAGIAGDCTADGADSRAAGGPLKEVVRSM